MAKKRNHRHYKRPPRPTKKPILSKMVKFECPYCNKQMELKLEETHDHRDKCYKKFEKHIKDEAEKRANEEGKCAGAKQRKKSRKGKEEQDDNDIAGNHGKGKKKV